MLDFVNRLLDPSGFVPRRLCGEWTPGLIWLHNVSDGLIWLAYLAIPLVLLVIARRRKDMPFRDVFFLFFAFIITCGFTHFLDVVMFYQPLYRLSGLTKALTAVASWTTVIALIPIVPRVLAMRTPEELAREIAARNRAEGELTASEQRYHTLLESASDFIAILTPDGIVREMNQRWVDLTGLPTERLIGHNVGEFAPNGAADEHVQTHSDAVSPGAVRNAPVKITRSNGSTVFIEFSSTSVDVGGERLVFSIGRDVTEHLRAEEALEQSREDQLRLKDEFLSHVSHELRTPVTAIMQFTTILLDGLSGELTTAQAEYQRIVLRNGQQLQSMIDDVLEVTRLATGKYTIEPESVSVPDAITDILNTYEATARVKSVTLSSDLPPSLPFAYAGRISLLRILTILVENAINVTVDGDGVTVRVRTLQRNPAFMLLEVCDGRCSLSPEAAETMFELFHQGPTTEHSSRLGLGLGLFVCKELVRRQGGQIWFEPQPKGGTLSFTLPTNS